MFFIAMCAAGHAQNWLAPMENFAPAGSPLSLQQHVEPEKPFTVAGECGAFVGQQDGQFEAWLFPVKILSHMQIEARMEGYDVPIDVTRHAAEIDVEPDHTTITYSHVAFTLRETFFAMFRDGYIYRGKRLVNWDAQLQTSVSDDETYDETIKGGFWTFRYPVKDSTPLSP